MGIGKWSARADTVARWFGVDRQAMRQARAAPPRAPRLRLRGGQVVLLTGPSGAGKSTLLQRLRRRSHRRASWVDLRQIRLAPAPVIDVMTDALGGGDDEPAIVAALRALSRVGLGEVWTYLRTPAQLSEGQRWRLRLALAIARAAPAPTGRLRVLAADEFAAPLDRVTAMVVARALRKAVSGQPGLCAVVATSHDDLAAALDPDLVVRCDFGNFELRERRPS